MVSESGEVVLASKGRATSERKASKGLKKLVSGGVKKRDRESKVACLFVVIRFEEAGDDEGGGCRRRT